MASERGKNLWLRYYLPQISAIEPQQKKRLIHLRVDVVTDTGHVPEANTFHVT